MSKNLVIVESPAKAKTIERYLGEEYKLTASVGHIRDLPASTIGVDVKNQFKPRYVTMKGKHKVVAELKKLAKDADNIILATDPDREGEAIAWHLAHILKLDPDSKCRVTFNEITEKTVQEAIKNPRSIDMNLVDAQQARRILDRLVGFELSPLLWEKIRKGLSAGRVQSVTSKMIVDKEREIKAFIPEEYWNLDVKLRKNNDELQFSARYQGDLKSGKVKKVKVNTKEEADAILADIDKDAFSVHEIKKGQRKRKAKPPYTTSTLQQDASARINFNSRRTMSVAQQLYEGVNIGGHGQVSLITYMRTDSVRISQDAINSVRSLIKNNYGEKYLPKKANYYANKSSNSQDAHEAIRPTHFDLSPEYVKRSLTEEQYRLYNLIWTRFVACQMVDAVIDTVTLDAKSNDHIFRTKGETIKFSGYMEVYNEYLSNEKEEIPELEEDEALTCDKIDAEQKFTQPPARYTEASLIKAMEENGIGRPSTYAPTISTILARQYVEKDGKSLVPTELGFLVTEMLEENFPDIVDVNFTAEMESDLDNVESGEMEGIKVLEEFYPDFHAEIEKAKDTISKVEIPEVELGEKCPKCGEGDLVIKVGRFGKFIACNRFPDCDYTDTMNYSTGRKCPLCGSEVVSRKSRRNRIFYTCDKKGKDPDCEFISWDLPVDDKKCETCGSYMLEKKRKSGDYIYCSNKECPTRQSKKSKSKEKEQDKEKSINEEADDKE